MKTPKSWKSTEDCFDLVEAMAPAGCSFELTLIPYGEDFYWEVYVSFATTKHAFKVEDEQPHKTQDDAANEGLRFARKLSGMLKSVKRKKA